MCLAIPGKILSREGDMALVELGGISRRVSLVLTPEARVGDYVIIHTGYAIGILDREAAEETLKLLEEMSEAG